MKATTVNSGIKAVGVLVITLACRFVAAADPRPLARPVLEEAALELRNLGILSRPSAEKVEQSVARQAHLSNSIGSLDDLTRAGSIIPPNEILAATKRQEAIATRLRGELLRAASSINPSEAVDYAGAVVEAHCEGLKAEFASGRPPTYEDYAVHLILALVIHKLPTPAQKSVADTVQTLVRIAQELRKPQSLDEAARRAYVRGVCDIH